MNSKSKLLIIVFLLPCLFGTGFTQGNWELILPPYPTSNQLVSLCFIDDQTGWAVGEYGTIVKTIDGGDTWRLIEISWLDNLRDVHFPTALTGYAVGKSGRIIKSSDGGENWSKLEVRYTNNLNRVKFRDENRGWIIGEKGLILYTDDGGGNWRQQMSNVGGDLKGIDFINESSLCVVGMDSTILLSNDEGHNWERTGFYIDTLCTDFNLSDVFFMDDQRGWIGMDVIRKGYSKGMILKSIDSGKSWSQVKIERHRYNHRIGGGGGSDGGGTGSSFKNGVQQIFFKDLQHGLCLLDGAYIEKSYPNIPLYTENEGKNWECIMHGQFEWSNQSGRFCYLTDNKVINTGFGGEFRFSFDSGLTWDYPNDSVRLLTNMIFGNHGRILAKKLAADSPDCLYLSSNDYGKTWESFTPQVFDSTGKSININMEGFFPGSFIDDRETLWINYWPKKRILKSEDFGRTWQCVRTGTNNNLALSIFLTPDTLIHYELNCIEITEDYYESELVFNHSFDGGKTVTSNRFPGTWNDLTQCSRSTHSYRKLINDCYFFNGHTGFIIGSDGNILKTTDTGQSWTSINSGVADNLWDIEFINQNLGFVVGEFGRILKTEDGGMTWRKTNSGTQEIIYAIGFKNELEGWAGTENGLRYTKDGGETWKGVPLRYQHGIVRHIEFDRSGNGYAYMQAIHFADVLEALGVYIPNSYNFLLFMKNEDVFVEHENDGGIIPKTLALYANYPNPFNPCTKIAYYLPAAGSVRLKIFNIQGQLIRTLVDSKQTGGEHQVSWDGLSDWDEKVTSGVYVYRIECGGEVRSRKMLVLR